MALLNPLEKIMAEEKVDRMDESEEIPAWFAKYADTMEKTHEEILKRLGDLESEEKEERAHEAADRKDMDEEDIDETTEGKERHDESSEEKEAAHKAGEELDRVKKEERSDESEEEKEKHLKEGGHKANEERWAKEREGKEDSTRKDAQISRLTRENREMKAKLEQVDSHIKTLFREPSYDDRNALAAARDRADSVYQAVTGKPASMPLPGESPISYRKRMADGLRKFSVKFKNERVDSLSGSAFETIEDHIYADAMAAAKAPENIKVGQLRSITRNDSGHTITEYIGDPKAAWRQFSAGASVRVIPTRPEKH